MCTVATAVFIRSTFVNMCPFNGQWLSKKMLCKLCKLERRVICCWCSWYESQTIHRKNCNICQYMLVQILHEMLYTNSGTRKTSFLIDAHNCSSIPVDDKWFREQLYIYAVLSKSTIRADITSPNPYSFAATCSKLSCTYSCRWPIFSLSWNLLDCAIQYYLLHRHVISIFAGCCSLCRGLIPEPV